VAESSVVLGVKLSVNPAYWAERFSLLPYSSKVAIISAIASALVIMLDQG